MAGSSTERFTEAGEFQASLSDIFAAIVVTAPGAFDARVARVTLRHVHLLRVREALSRVAYVSLAPDLVYVSFSTDPSLPMFWRGRALGPGEIMLHKRGERLHQRVEGASRWGLIALPKAVLASYSETETGYALTLPEASQILRPSSSDRKQLLRILGDAARLADTRPKILDHPEVIRAMEYEIAGPLVRCLTEGLARTESPAARMAATVMSRFEEVLSANPHRNLNAAELREALGVGDRTLHTCCLTFLGVSARRYMQARRLTLVRAAILRADPRTARIMDIARCAGFDDSRSFARLYGVAYGETPATTLRWVADA